MGYNPGGGSGGGTPATTVTGPDTFGASAVVGTGTKYARNDHDHGLPANPVSAANIEATFTAANQIYKGTGSGTGALQDFDTVFNFQFGAKGQIFVGTGAGTGAKVGVGSDGTVLTADSTQASGVKWATPSGSGLLARIQYGPSVYAANQASSSSLTAVDATNLTIPFTVPASGNVLVRLTGVCLTTPTAYGYWGLLDHTSQAQVGNTTMVSQSGVSLISAPFLITGLTPGANLQYDWAYAVSSAAIYLPVQGAQGIPSGVNGAPATMEVWAA